MWKGDLQSFPSPPRMPRILHDVPMRHLPKVSDALWAGCFWGVCPGCQWLKTPLGLASLNHITARCFADVFLAFDVDRCWPSHIPLHLGGLHWHLVKNCQLQRPALHTSSTVLQVAGRCWPIDEIAFLRKRLTHWMKARLASAKTADPQVHGDLEFS